MSIKYSVVIPTYNHCDDLLKPCIETLFKYSRISDIELIVSANGCTDNTFEYLNTLKEKFASLGMTEHLKVVWNNPPLGYSRACNAGIEVATADYIVLLNNDVVFLEQYKNRWLELFQHQFDIDPNCGISCVIKGPSEPAGHDFAVFFIVMIHRKVFDKIGLLNTEYGVGGGEDTEFCIETERAGFTVRETVLKEWSEHGMLYVGDFPVYHKGEGTMHDPTLVPEWDRIFNENSIRLAKKYNREWYKWAISNNAERGVFFKGDPVYPREKFRYQFASYHIEGTKVLEIGCSSGYGVQFLPSNIEYTGIDYDREIIDAAKMQEWRPNITFMQADINEFPLEQYDTIIAFETLEHIPNGLALIEKLKQHCKKLIISVPYNEDPGQFSPHHLVHNIKPENFPGFNVHGLLDIDGHLSTNYKVEPGVEYNLIAIWSAKNPIGNQRIDSLVPTNILARTNTVANNLAPPMTIDYRNKLRFLEPQHPEIFKELIEENVYGITREQIEGKHVIDVGANIGMYSLLVAELGAKKVIAVEPIGESFNQMCKNIHHAGYRNVVPLKNVVSNEPNTFVNISIMPNSGHNSAYNVSENYETVYSTTLSELLKGCEGDDIVLKLDCEGAEYDILLNATKEDMSRINRVMLEIHAELHPVYKGFEILNDKMREFGFVVDDVKQVYSWEVNERGEQVNWKMIPYRVEVWKR